MRIDNDPAQPETMNVTKTLNVLIVEDSPTQAEELRYVLERHGYSVLSAKNGKEALVSMRAHKPDLVISDIIMPEMGGFTLCKKIKAEKDFLDVPVILLTALSDAEDVLKGLECGADDFITKPYDKQYLIRRIQGALFAAGSKKEARPETGLEISLGERRYFITSGREHILDLLLSTYETAVMKNRQFSAALIELKALNERLLHEIAERQRAEENLKDSLKEKDVLLKELYHRTKNNMNVISGLISLQMNAIKDPKIRQMFKEAQDRIHSMALVHEMLYKTKELSKLDLKDYLEQLATFVTGGYKAGNISLNLELDSVPVSLYVATPCGLIVNELLSNSLKHAFPDRSGQINLSLRANGNEIELACFDNGTGFPEGFQIGRSSSLGLKLVENLVRKQLLGSLEILEGKGAGLAIRFDITRLEGKDKS